MSYKSASDTHKVLKHLSADLFRRYDAPIWNYRIITSSTSSSNVKSNLYTIYE